MKSYIVAIIVTIFWTALFMFALMAPMSRGEASAIVNERGSFAYEDDTIYIYLPEAPCTLEIEAAARLAETAEGVVIDFLYVDYKKNTN